MVAHRTGIKKKVYTNDEMMDIFVAHAKFDGGYEFDRSSSIVECKLRDGFSSNDHKWNDARLYMELVGVDHYRMGVDYNGANFQTADQLIDTGNGETIGETMSELLSYAQFHGGLKDTWSARKMKKSDDYYCELCDRCVSEDNIYDTNRGYICGDCFDELESKGDNVHERESRMKSVKKAKRDVKKSVSFSDMVASRRNGVRKMFLKDENGKNIHLDEEFTINVGGNTLTARYDYDYDSDYGEGGIYEISIMSLFEDNNKCLWTIGKVLASYDTMRISLSVEEGVLDHVFLEYQDYWDDYVTLRGFSTMGATFEQIVHDIETWLNMNCTWLKRNIEVDGQAFEFYCEDEGVFHYYLDADYLGWGDCGVSFDDNDGHLDYCISSYTDAGDYEMEGRIDGYDVTPVLREAVLFFKDCGVIEKSAKKSKARKSNVKKFAHQ